MSAAADTQPIQVISEVLEAVPAKTVETVTVHLKPTSEAEFNAVVAATGGEEGWRYLTQDAIYKPLDEDVTLHISTQGFAPDPKPAPTRFVREFLKRAGE